jgi:surfeit locus 1 family protein
MNFIFRPKVTAVTLILVAGMIRASVWQWDRHLQKEILIEKLNNTLQLEPISLAQLIHQSPTWAELAFRRVKVSGSFDFEHEFLLRNRNLDGRAGSHVITPLKVDGTEMYVLVDRGFLPWGRERKDERVKYQRSGQIELFGLIKESVPPKLLGPKDPPAGPLHPWVDQWLRIDVPHIQQQLPFTILPVYLETMQDPNDPLLSSKIVREGSAGRNDVLMYTGQQVRNFGMDSPDTEYPIPTYDITPPPDIHLGYVFEWAFMALITLCIGLLLQFKRPSSRGVC